MARFVLLLLRFKDQIWEPNWPQSLSFVLPLRERQENDSVAHMKGRNEEAGHLFTTGKVCFLTFDIEHRGECCGIIQISAEFIRMSIEDEEPANGFKSNDKPAYVDRHIANALICILIQEILQFGIIMPLQFMSSWQLIWLYQECRRH